MFKCLNFECIDGEYVAVRLSLNMIAVELGNHWVWLSAYANPTGTRYGLNKTVPATYTHDIQ